MFNIRFEVIEVYESGVRVTHYLKGKRKDVKKDIELYKAKAKKYIMVGKNGMVMWV